MRKYPTNFKIEVAYFRASVFMENVAAISVITRKRDHKTGRCPRFAVASFVLGYSTQAARNPRVMIENMNPDGRGHCGHQQEK